MKKLLFLLTFCLTVVISGQVVLADNLLQVFTSKDYNSADNSTVLYWRTSSKVDKAAISFNCAVSSGDNLHLTNEFGANFYCGSETTLASWSNNKEGSVKLYAVNLQDIKNPVTVNFTLTLKKNDGSVIKQSKVLGIRFNPIITTATDHIPLLSTLTSEETGAYGGATLFSWTTKDADEVNLIIRNSSLSSKVCLPQFKITNVETKEVLGCGDIDRRMPGSGTIYLKFENLNSEDAAVFFEVAPMRSSFNGTIPLSQNLSFIIPTKFTPPPVIVTSNLVVAVTTPTPTVTAADEALKKQIADLKKIIADLERRIAEILAKRTILKK